MTPPPSGPTGYNAGDNLLHLLGLAPESRVLIVGEELRPWWDRFRDCRFIGDLSSLPAPDTFLLLLVDPASAEAALDPKGGFAVLKGVMAPEAVLLVFAVNRWGLRHLKARIRGTMPTKGARFGYRGLQRALAEAGIDGQRLFVPMGPLFEADEFAAPGTEFMEIPRHWNRAYHLAHRLGAYHEMADGFLVVAGDPPLEFRGTVRAITDWLAANGEGAPRLRVERFDLRLRGALVLFLKERGRPGGMIARLVSDPALASTLGKNAAFLTSLRDATAGCDAVTALLPHPLLNRCVDGSSVFVESLLPGVIAWKVVSSDNGEGIALQAADFLVAMRDASSQRVILRERTLDELIPTRLAEEGVSGDREVADGFARVAHALRQGLADRELGLGCSHGDFGYGNILVDPGSARLTGVIDWDTARLSELPGVDFYNFLLQRSRIEKGSGLFSAWQDLVRGLVFERYRELWLKLGVTEDLRDAVGRLALLRYLARSARYPAVFSSERDECRSVLAHVLSEWPA
ncbi:phosphotransferase family protein [Geomonas edaphica]|uniref:phosphotransferase family protein n=1 Tax=Geomonas edaphica TaxID=2570226 RepID=UPI0010A93A9C|nr:phosphotransferase [Geomonas edaphica]